MKKSMWLRPKDIIAALVVIGYIVLKLAGTDGTVNAAFMLIIAYYFVKRQEGKDNGR